MAGPITPPFRAGRLIADGEPLEVSRRAGDLTLTAGAGSLIRRAGRSVVIDNVFNEIPESFGLFTPGTPAGVLGTWRNTTRDRTAYLRKLVANFAVAQGTADVDNYYRLKITDEAAASVVVPFTAAVRSFLLDQGYGAVLDKGLASFNPVGVSSAWSAGWGNARGFTVAQEQTVTALVIRQGLDIITSGQGGPVFAQPAAVRGSILDAAGNILVSGYTPPFVGTASGNAARIAFDASITLVPGETYYMAWDIFETCSEVTGGTQAQRDGNLQVLRCLKSNTQTAQPNTGPLDIPATNALGALVDPVTWPSAHGVSSATVVAAVQALTWAGVFDGAQVTPTPAINIDGPTASYTARDFAWEILGSPSGLAVLSGDLTFEVDTVGAPPGTGLGTGLNIHSILSAA